MCNLLYTIQFSVFYISEYFLRGLRTTESPWRVFYPTSSKMDYVVKCLIGSCCFPKRMMNEATGPTRWRIHCLSLLQKKRTNADCRGHLTQRKGDETVGFSICRLIRRDFVRWISSCFSPKRVENRQALNVVYICRFHWAGISTCKPVRVCTIEDKGVYPTGLILIMTVVWKYKHIVNDKHLCIVDIQQGLHIHN
jgi:hypothetical protein